MKFLRTLLAIGVTVTLLACGGAEERKAAYMAKAEQSLSVGDLDKARIDLKNVLQIDPKDAGAWFKLGTIFERKQEMKKAFKHYNKAAELEPENMEYQGKVGRFYLILGNDIDKATEKMELILAQNPDDVNGLLLKAGILLRQGNAADAKEISRDLFEDHPENLENAIFLSSMYSKDQEYAEAINVLDAALEQRDVPHSEPDAYQTFQRLQQRLWDAIEQLQRHVERYGPTEK
jgi:Tfp pilus assembly protein PilF